MMSSDSVREHYAQYGVGEWRRLVKDPFHRLEFETTLHFLLKRLPPSGHVLDAGGGPGRYTIDLAKRGYDLTLYDLTPELLEIARRRIARAGVKRRVREVAEGSIVDLSRYPSNHFDAVICLGGPLSHVRTLNERQQAMRELVRVVKPDGTIAVSVMGRLAVVADTIRYWPGFLNNHAGFLDVWQNGDDNFWYGRSFAHFFLPDELDALIESSGVEVLDRVGLEGLGSHAEPDVNRVARTMPEAWQNWLDSHLTLCTHPAVYATSSHMLVVGKKRNESHTL